MKKILIIEDDSQTNSAYSSKLSANYFVTSAIEGKQGVSKAIKENPDLIILDIMLPGGLNGFDVLRELKHNSATSQIPVIVLTNLEEQEQAAKAGGAVGCLVKANTSIDEVENIIKKHLQ
ncbi:MAG TPA: response regulator [Patescibacteria group bacterium]|uniref:Response regulatory domain-containing protein n=1 Tax=Candidatus Woesebacteria bacterium RBG_13_46_13 TaxID=1802479 RepID=A0A1F7X3J2_9BACT|nr:MAG: hypothetical protein A2Y68_03480 [Candidatus Woesebacteria bacterium RBG_13_46_13]HJX59609.1 response regulator [Patescibacteria group bacterium]